MGKIPDQFQGSVPRSLSLECSSEETGTIVGCGVYAQEIDNKLWVVLAKLLQNLSFRLIVLAMSFPHF